MLFYGRHVGAPPKGQKPLGSPYKTLQTWVKYLPEYATALSLYGGNKPT